MSRTYRRDEHVKFQEGNPKKLDINYKCRCERCTTDKNRLKDKILKKEMKKELKKYKR